MSGTRYPIDTIAQMAAIPPEALPRFLIELPIMLDTLRRFKEVPLIVNELVGQAVLEEQIINGIVWVDDEERSITASVTFAGFGDEHDGSLQVRGSFKDLIT